MLNIFVLTYAGSKFTPQVFRGSETVSCFQVVKNTFRPVKDIPKTTVFAFQFQITSFEFYRLFARSFSRAQTARFAISVSHLLAFPFSRNLRLRLGRGLQKSQAVRWGHELLWERALQTDSPCLFLEDDASLAINEDLLMNSLSDLTSGLGESFGVELSQSYSFTELGITKSQSSEIYDIQGVGTWIRVSPGASNTTCAAFYSQSTIAKLKAFSSVSRFQLLPIDYFIDYFYLRNRKSVINYHLVPGAFLQGSEFRQSP